MNFLNMGDLVKTQVGNGLSKIFGLPSQTIDVSDQAVFTLKDFFLRDYEGKKTSVSNLFRASQRRSGSFWSFLMTVHPYQYDPNCKHSRIPFRECIQLPLDVYGIDAIIVPQIPGKLHIFLVPLVALDNGINPGRGTLKKDSGEIFSECCTKNYKESFLHYVN